MMSKIILLSEVFKLREQRDRELKYYHAQLEKLESKLFFINKEIQLTNYIINMIETEAIQDLSELVNKQD